MDRFYVRRESCYVLPFPVGQLSLIRQDCLCYTWQVYAVVLSRMYRFKMFKYVVCVTFAVSSYYLLILSKLCRVVAGRSPQVTAKKRGFSFRSDILYESSLRVAILRGLIYGLFWRMIDGLCSP